MYLSAFAYVDDVLALNQIGEQVEQSDEVCELWAYYQISLLFVIWK